MISFNYETKFQLKKEPIISDWISQVIDTEGYKQGNINYVFCEDAYLHKLNIEFLSHDSFTDIISFDESIGKIINGDIFISIERVKENAAKYNTTFLDELCRVMVHGVLHYCGYKDKTDNETEAMRKKENFYLALLS